jgi:hypothetical protein
MFRYCMFASASIATRHIIMLKEKVPEATFSTVKAIDVMREAAIRVVDCAFEMLTRETTH